jgi:hypothetical protein
LVAREEVLDERETEAGGGAGDEEDEGCHFDFVLCEVVGCGCWIRVDGFGVG